MKCKEYIFILLAVSLCFQNQRVNAQNESTAIVVKNKKFKLKKRRLRKQLNKLSIYENSYVGLSVYDVRKKKFVFNYNDQRYFLPASNAKLFTFFAALTYIKPQIPALKYIEKGDSLIIWGTGNPAFLHSSINDSIAFQFLNKQTKNIFLSDNNFNDKRFGSGWAWDDFPTYFSAEKSSFPIYGNVIRFTAGKNGKLTSLPKGIGEVNKFKGKNHRFWVTRDENDNRFLYSIPKLKSEVFREIPFRTSIDLSLKLLSDTLKRKVKKTDLRIANKGAVKTLYSISRDSLLKQMMQVSDNFLAEHILLMCSDSLNNSRRLNTKIVIKHVLDKDLASLTNRPRWVDGSGLSRYNLFTPRSFVETLIKILDIFGSDAQGINSLFNLLPTGGKTGTLKQRFNSTPPFLYAKTGTLSNNHNLSGYLVTKSGKLLVFSFMNNHYLHKTSDIKEQMDKILTDFYLYY